MRVEWTVVGMNQWVLSIGERVTATVYRSYLGHYVRAGLPLDMSAYPTLAAAQAVAEDAAVAQLEEELKALMALRGERMLKEQRT